MPEGAPATAATAAGEAERRLRLAEERTRRELLALPFPVTHRTAAVISTTVTVDDGTELATHIQLPDVEGPVPVILQRTPYAHLDQLTRITAEGFAARGIGFVWQYCRGTGGSDGEWTPNVNERADGISTVHWLAGQPWVESIGYFGSSYLALTGWAMADALPDAVKGLYLSHYGTDRFVSAYQGGLFRHDVLTGWAMENAGFPITADYLASCRYLPQREVDEALWGGRLDWYRDWVSHPDGSDGYWNRGFWGMLRDIPQRVKLPVCLVEGWYDHHLGSALRTWRDLPEQTRAMSQLHIGAWNHYFEPCVFGSAVPPAGDVARAFTWFKELLCDATVPDPIVRYFEIGPDQWQRADAYPFPPAASQDLALTDEASDLPGARRLRAIGGAGDGHGGSGPTSVVTAPPPVNGSARTDDRGGDCAGIDFVFDPTNPVPSHGAESMLVSVAHLGSLPQPEPGWRDDVISFVSDPVEEPLCILGPIVASIWVSTDALDTAMVIKVSEIGTDGRSRNIRTGVASIAYRDGSLDDSYTPGDVVLLDITTWDVAWTLLPGTRLRLDVTSSDFPQYSVHTNQRGLWSAMTHQKCARQRIHCGPDHLSVLRLPVTPTPASGQERN